MCKNWKIVELKTNAFDAEWPLVNEGVYVGCHRAPIAVFEVALAKCCKIKIQNKLYVSLLSRKATIDVIIHNVSNKTARKKTTQFITSCFSRLQRPDVFYEALWHVYSSEVTLDKLGFLLF